MTTRENKPDLIPSGKAPSEYHCEDTKDCCDEKYAKEIAQIKQKLDEHDMKIKTLEDKKQPASIFDMFIKHPYLVTGILIAAFIGVASFICWQKMEIIHYVDRSIDSLRCICYSKK